MDIWREGNITGNQVAAGDAFSIQLLEADVQRLADPDQRYTMSKFMESRTLVPGWEPDDKVHIWLKNPVLPQDQTAIANVSVDAEGDLYFTIWDSEKLRQAHPCEAFTELDTFVQSDSGSRLQRAGIHMIRLYNLPDLSQKLQSTNR